EIIGSPYRDGPAIVWPGLPPPVSHVAHGESELVREHLVTLQGVSVVALLGHQAGLGVVILEPLWILRKVRQRDILQQFQRNGIEAVRRNPVAREWQPDVRAVALPRGQ